MDGYSSTAHLTTVNMFEKKYNASFKDKPILKRHIERGRNDEDSVLCSTWIIIYIIL